MQDEHDRRYIVRKWVCFYQRWRLARFLEFIFGFKLHFARARIKRAEGRRREQRVVRGQTADW